MEKTKKDIHKELNNFIGALTAKKHKLPGNREAKFQRLVEGLIHLSKKYEQRIDSGAERKTDGAARETVGGETPQQRTASMQLPRITLGPTPQPTPAQERTIESEIKTEMSKELTLERDEEQEIMNSLRKIFSQIDDGTKIIKEIEKLYSKGKSIDAENFDSYLYGGIATKTKENGAVQFANAIKAELSKLLSLVERMKKDSSVEHGKIKSNLENHEKLRKRMSEASRSFSSLLNEDKEKVNKEFIKYYELRGKFISLLSDMDTKFADFLNAMEVEKNYLSKAQSNPKSISESINNIKQTHFRALEIISNLEKYSHNLKNAPLSEQASTVQDILEGLPSAFIKGRIARLGIFYIKNDSKLGLNLMQIPDYLVRQDSDNSAFLHHVGQNKNHFASWIENVDEEEAKKIKRIKDKAELIQELRDYIKRANLK